MRIINTPAKKEIVLNIKEDDGDLKRSAEGRKEAFKRMDAYQARIAQQIKESRELIKSW